ncbi:MAG TPA: hypothetical protein VF331_05460 [Polyangiales bacterium]
MTQTLDTRVSMLVERFEDAHHQLSQHAKEQPYAVLAVAAGLGFILGGGLSSRLIGSWLSVGGRTLVSRLALDWLASTVERRAPESIH